ncbi:MAG: cytochrome c/FTR1 family iron permease, partial [Oligoflexales bacterium]|nr:cytochrome c/FTR1 family iron permease [Oligoflexales bacterium]
MLGENVYKTNGATCHGGKGRADTPLSKTLMPAPTNFHDEDLMLLSSPFKFFNTLETGIKGTAMPSFKAILSEEECWSVSFYLSSLRFSAELGESSNFDVSKFSEGKSAEPIYVAALARMSDSELESHLKKIGSLHESESKKWLAYMRREAPYQKLVPLDSSSAFVEEQAQPGQALLSSPSPQDATQQRLAFLRKKLTDAEKAFSEHRRQAAEGFLLDAYLDGFDGLEMDLLLIDSAFVKGVELEFIKARSLASSADLQSFQSSLAVLRQALDRAEGLLSKTRVDTKDSPFWESAKLSSFFSSFMIIVREGFEAFLVIAALLAMASQLGVARARYFVHLGWLSAVLAGFVTYFLFEKILSLSGSARELVEAVSTGIAALVLFYTGFWLLSQSERQRWMAELKTRASSALHQNQLWVIFSLSFIAAYREAAETVLFYSALFNNTASPGSVVLGLVMGSVLLFSVGWCILRYQIKLPLRKFFLLTSSLMILLSVILTGKAVKELIEAGLVHSTQLSFVPAIELLGIYPSLETLMSQCGLLFLGVLLYGAWKRKKRSSETF